MRNFIHLFSLQNSRYIDFVFALICISGFCLSYYLGFIGPDSTNYLEVAKNFSKGEGCYANGEYFSIHPCGYPILISLFSFLFSLFVAEPGQAVFVGSKLLNYCLYALDYLILTRLLNSKIKAVSVLVMFFSITLHTWSENLMLFSLFGVVYFLNIISYKYHKKHLIFLLFFLIIGILSRYIFSFVIFFMFIFYFFIYGKRLALKVFPVFFVSFLFFIFYIFINYYNSGYISGMPRGEPRESLIYLLFSFFRSFFYMLSLILTTFVISFYVYVLIFHFNVMKSIKNQILLLKDIVKDLHGFVLSRNRILIFICCIGFSYLMIEFVVRIFIHYDLYGYRTLITGFALFLFPFLFALYENNKHNNFGAIFFVLLLTMFFLKVVISSTILFAFDLNNQNILGAYHLIKEDNRIKSSNKILQNAKYVYTFNAIQGHHKYMVGDIYNYYKKGVKVYFVSGEPYALDTLISQLKKHAKASCFFDLGMFKTKEVFENYLNSEYQFSIEIKGLSINPLFKQGYSSTLRDFFRDVYQTKLVNGVVSCNHLIDFHNNYKKKNANLKG